MSNLINSFLIDPVVRQARRFSGAVPPSSPDRLSHANAGSPPTPAHAVRAAGCSSPHRDEDEYSQRGDVRPQVQQRTLPSAVVDDEENNDGSPHMSPLTLSRSRPGTPSEPISIPPAEPPGMSSNPSRALENQLRRLELDSPLSVAPAGTTTDSSGSPASGPSTAEAQQPRQQPQQQQQQHHATPMAESLPADDGMRHLRARIHEIRGLHVDDAEKARLMHTIMTERYNHMRPTSPNSFVSNDRPFTPTSGHSIFSDVQVSSPYSAASDVDPENPFNLRPGDTDPTYRLPAAAANAAAEGDGDAEEEEEEEEDFDIGEDGPTLGCKHYKRNVKVQCHQCRRWYTCRHCHDAVESHSLIRNKIINMLCMVCGTAQKAGEYCVQCGTQAACYYCEICKLWDNNSTKKIYHCLDCGICRRGEGLGKDFSHCKRCNVCISIAHAENHRCLERATDCDCPICGEYLFNSSSAVVSLPCGHYLHKGCYNLYMETAYKCPMCKKSAVNMELQWRKLTQAIEVQPMPDQFSDTVAVIQCNDCSAKSSVKYHWLGNKCNTCDSYNTNELRILNGPESEQNAHALLQAADAHLRVHDDSGARSPASVSSPSSVPLPSPRYYFQPDEPQETWLSGQLPSLPFQIPQFPGMPQMPQFPGMPQMPQFPGMPGIQIPHFPGMPQLPPFPPFPQMPQMPEAATELLERLSKTFSPFRNYLNPTGEVSEENVPIIDLSDDRTETETRATDGSTVREPSLPQYVVERFSRSFMPLRNYLNTPTERIPNLDLSEDADADGLQFWGEDGHRVDRMISGDEEEGDDGDDEDSESDESVDDEDDEEDEEGDGDEHRGDLDLPWHP